MAAASVFFLCRPRLLDSYRGLVFIPASLAFLTCIFIFCYISSTSTLIYLHNNNHILHSTEPIRIPTKPIPIISLPKRTAASSVLVSKISNLSIEVDDQDHLGNGREGVRIQSKLTKQDPIGSIENPLPTATATNNDVYHDRDTFLENYRAMNKTLKIYIYPHKRDDPFANVLLPSHSEPGGNYASESFFKQALMSSHFITDNPSQADFFFLPFSIASMRHDPRIGVGGIQDFVKDYVFNVSHKYPFWNRTGGADHFYVACHSIGKVAMDKAEEVRNSVVQVVCTSNYFVQGYVPHKDVCPCLRFGPDMMILHWLTHQKGLRSEHGQDRGCDRSTMVCVPVVLADHYDLPFADILNWKSFSVVVATADIPSLKRILRELGFEEYLRLQRNVVEVRRHFQWHVKPVEFDVFYMVMYELWLRRGHVRISSF
ncbi:hypothetical protein Acr_20g0010990 [Actinidia rufa]|uniref:Exostosin GT47 domain-containing protein n=1 Tax=Actinidia rufa TaxID=165716 RepID=A0A7J0GEU5_9ERIC|nr:hypothetical protein Acr_20g0010990 [Actinidia rufa]